jgi:murein DD-endopeptidase MepM/ murein hydrolase activator NlpD
MVKTPPDRYLLMPKPAVNEPKKPQKATILNLQDIEKNKNSHLISNTNIISVKNNSVGITKKLDNLQITEKNSKKSIISINNKKLLKLNFQWPLKGKLTRSFSQTDNKGIQISGKNGQTVVAAEAGKAVYCGHGLAGLGNVAIIKHNETFLSAYANNSRLVVKEGQQVGKGQAIGQLGQTGLKKATLHFEIRKNGKPINPLMLLPEN